MADFIKSYPAFDLGVLRGDSGDELRERSEWNRVFAHFHPRLTSYFKARADGILPLDDLLQEIWLRALLHISSLDSDAALWAWLVTIGANLLRDELRRDRPPIVPIERVGREGDVVEYLGLPVVSKDEEMIAEAHDLRQRVTAEEWEFLNLLCVDNFTHDEVAVLLGLKTAMASRQRLRRIRQRLVQ